MKTVPESRPPQPTAPTPEYPSRVSRTPTVTRASRLRYSFETYIAIVALVGILAHLTMRFAAGQPPGLYLLPLYAVLVLGGIPVLFGLLRKLAALEFGSDLLAGISIATAVILGEYLVACIVVLMLSGGTALEQYATRRASSILEALSHRMPSVAHRKQSSGIADITLNQIEVGDTLIVFPHELCPVDGVVSEGHGWMDESYLSGEPYQMPKVSGAQVLSGSINGDAALTIRATKLPVDSRYSRIMRVMQEAEANRPHLQRLGDRLGAWYTPVALAIAAAGWMLSGSADRFLSVVVIATPCPLLIGIPVAIIGAISLAARRGIIIKNPAMLERIATCRTVILDKTGTLTYGKPSLSDIAGAPGFRRDDVLRLTACLEQYSKHPLAAAVLTAAKEAQLRLEPVAHISEIPGRGLNGTVGDAVVEITSRQTIVRQGREVPAELIPTEAGLESLVFINGVYAALLRFRDEPRRESRSFISHLSPRHGVRKIVLLSGDRESEVSYLAGRVGISEMYFGKSPEEKVAIVAHQNQRASPNKCLCCIESFTNICKGGCHQKPIRNEN